MRKINNVTSFEFLDDKLIYATGQSVYCMDKSIAIGHNVHTFIQTKEFLVIVTGSENVGFAIAKDVFISGSIDFTRIPKCVSINTYNYENDLLKLFSEIPQEKKSWMFNLNYGIQNEYVESFNFIPYSDYIFFYQNPIPFFDQTGSKLQTFNYIKNRKGDSIIPEPIGIINGIVWIYLCERELVYLDLKSGANKLIDPFSLILSQGVDPLYIGFGGETNPYRFHLDTAGGRIVTFANRYYCEISLIDFSVKVIDLFLLSPLQISIVKSRWCPESKWLYFIGRAKGDKFEKYMGVFDTVSGTFLQLDRIDDKDGFFGHPPLFGKGIYGALADNVLYIKEISPL